MFSYFFKASRMFCLVSFECFFKDVFEWSRAI